MCVGVYVCLFVWCSGLLLHNRSFASVKMKWCTRELSDAPPRVHDRSEPELQPPQKLHRTEVSLPLAQRPQCTMTETRTHSKGDKGVEKHKGAPETSARRRVF